MSSLNEVNTFRLEKFEDHPNADRLKLVRIPDTEFVYCANYEEWKDRVGSMVAWVPPENLVKVSRSEFSWLADQAKYDENSVRGMTYARVRGKKIRGVVSYGILVPVSNDIPEGQNVAELLEVVHYDSDKAVENSNKHSMIVSGESEKADQDLPGYDIESFMKNAKVFVENEPVCVTLKYHGSTWRGFHNGERFFCGSRKEFKREVPTKPKICVDQIIEKLGEEEGLRRIAELEAKLENWSPKKNVWWQALEQDENLQKFLRDNVNAAVYGEVVPTQGGDFYYGCKPGEAKVFVFDIFKDGKFMNVEEAKNLAPDLNWVHCFKWNHPFNKQEMISLVENMPKVYRKVEEGIVIKPMVERWDHKVGRVQLKLINPEW